MKTRVGTASYKYGRVVCAFCALVATGCAGGGSAGRVAELPAYYGPRPGPVQTPPKGARRWAPTVRRPAAPTNNWMPRGRLSNRWECIVVHHSASDRSTPEGMRAYHMRDRGWDELGYHFVIGNGVGYPDGRVFVGERWKSQMHGAHCKTPGNYHNEHGVGICLIGNLENHPPTAKQLDSLARLLAFLSEKSHIPRSRIYTHGGVTNKTVCPGQHFSLSNVLRRMSTHTVSASFR